MNLKPESDENQTPEDLKPAKDEISPEDAANVTGGAFDTYMQFHDPAPKGGN